MALRFDANLQSLSSEAPLHEGRSESVLGSSTEGALASRKGEAVFGSCGCDRKSPDDISGGIADQEKEISFEIIEYGENTGQFEGGDACDVRRGNGAMPAGYFSNDEIADCVMIRGHERQTLGHPSRNVFQRLEEFGVGNGADLASPADQKLSRHV